VVAEMSLKRLLAEDQTHDMSRADRVGEPVMRGPRKYEIDWRQLTDVPQTLKLDRIDDRELNFGEPNSAVDGILNGIPGFQGIRQAAHTRRFAADCQRPLC